MILCSQKETCQCSIRLLACTHAYEAQNERRHIETLTNNISQQVNINQNQIEHNNLQMRFNAEQLKHNKEVEARLS